MQRDLTSVSVLSEVVVNLGLTKEFEKNADGSLTRASKRRRDSLARSLAGRIAVASSSPTPQMDIVRVTYTGPDPTIGKRLVEEVKRTYISHTMAWIHEFLKSQRDYFLDESKEARKEVGIGILPFKFLVVRLGWSFHAGPTFAAGIKLDI